MKQRKGETREEYLERCRKYDRERWQRRKQRESEKKKEYYKKNRDKLLERSKENYKNNREKKIKYNLEHYNRFAFVLSEEKENIENYELALADNFIGWDLHHRKEEEGFSRNKLKELDLYYNRPANELIFLTKGEHSRLHGRLRNGLNRRTETEN